MFAGCGFLGEAAAALFFEAGWEVHALCASETSAARLAARGWRATAADARGSEVWPLLPRNAQVWVHALSTRGGSASDYQALYLQSLQNALAECAPRRVIFLSSTSVYAQKDGSWVDEDSPAEPQTETGRILRAAEEVALAAGGVVLRLAGLYGPGRSVFLQRFLAGEAKRSESRWINHIHRDDAAAAVFLAATLPPGIYNVSDDNPSTPAQLCEWIAESLGVPLPPEGEMKSSQRRGGSNKRVCNRKLRKAGWVPRYPSYRQALPGLLKASPPGS